MSQNDSQREKRTKRLSDQALEELRLSGHARSERPELALVAYHRDGALVAPLAEGSSVVVGRSHPADVTIRDPSLSRQHACFEVEDGRVWVEDLESTNGTTIDGLRVDRAEVREGVEVYLGAVIATVQRLSSLEKGAPELVSHDRFLAELDVEITRARTFGRSLALLMVRSGADDPVHVSRWLAALSASLRAFDRVALYSAHVAEVVLPEATSSTGLELARSVVSKNGHLRCGLAVLGEGVNTADALLEAARRALQKTSKESPVLSHPGDASTAKADDPTLETGEVIAESPSMKKLLATIARIANTSIPVLIHGETGAGKEVVARALHEGGKRKGKPLIAINCGAIPNQLIESTLFGHERGAFTGASGQAKGVFESASGGTVLLDEIGELPPAAQTTLLRVLETKTITRVGSTKEIAVDLRVVAATHRDLEAMCDEGTFRRDLLYRLDAMSLMVPPLRKRPEDITPLARRFLTLAAEENGCGVDDISHAALELLLGYGWPGNVRELRNTIERAAVIAQGRVIDVDDLPERVRGIEDAKKAAERGRRLERRELGDGSNAAAEGREGDEPPEMINLKAEVRSYEAALVRRAMRAAGWKRKEAARLLGIPRRTLVDKLQAYEIKPE